MPLSPLADAADISSVTASAVALPTAVKINKLQVKRDERADYILLHESDSDARCMIISCSDRLRKLFCHFSKSSEVEKRVKCLGYGSHNLRLAQTLYLLSSINTFSG